MGYLLIHRACLNGDALVVAALIHIGCDPSAKTEAGLTGVHLAAMRGQLVILSLLAESGVKLGEFDSQNKLPLHYAAANNQVIVAAWLLQATKVDWTTAFDGAGRTPLHLASEAGHQEMVRFLLSTLTNLASFDKPLDPMTRDHLGNTYLHSALASVPSPITQ
ncbi:unnamed protein product [Echinostoma caproni]|uniref:ANK_REP_REGION domain-containing protein n=1 Tax=Echinostoma caproni TaxID=27848 RepID=A0A183AWU1_9TREM|nr:unnamed protein product [Echinostoma caproni]